MKTVRVKYSADNLPEKLKAEYDRWVYHREYQATIPEGIDVMAMIFHNRMKNFIRATFKKAQEIIGYRAAKNNRQNIAITQ